jgi:hypothetical protein
MAIGDKLPELDPITAVEIASDDLYYIVDISEDTSKKMTAEELATYIINENETWRISNYSGSSLGDVSRSNTQAFIFHSGAVGAKGFFVQGGETQAVKNSGTFNGLWLVGNNEVYINSANTNNGEVVIGSGVGGTQAPTLWTFSERIKSTMIHNRNFDSTSGTPPESTVTHELHGSYVTNRINFDNINPTTDVDSFYAAFRANPNIQGAHLAANPQKIFSLYGKGRIKVLDYGSGSVLDGVPVYGIGVTADGVFVETDQINNPTPYFLVASPGGSSSYSDNKNIIYLSWTGGSGTYNLTLPSAADIPYRSIQIISDGTLNANDKVHVLAPVGESIDGSPNPGFYTLNKSYNGVTVWSDGSNWIVTQAKAT